MGRRGWKGRLLRLIGWRLRCLQTEDRLWVNLRPPRYASSPRTVSRLLYRMMKNGALDGCDVSLVIDKNDRVQSITITETRGRRQSSAA